jgi:hypothetical protein
MAGTQAIIEVSAQDRGALPLIQELAKGMKGIEDAILRTEAASKKSEKSVSDDFSKMAQGGAKFAMSFLGIVSGAQAAQTAVRILAADYEHLNQQIERSRQTALSVSGGNLNANLSFTPDESMKSFNDVDARVNKIADQYKVPRKKVYELASTTMGARGTASNATALDAAESALRLAPNLDTAQQQAIARSTLGLMNTYKIDADTAKGMMIQGAAEHNVDLAQYAQFVVPGIKNLGNMGATAQEAFSLTAGLANAQLDPYGRESTTASEGFMMQLREATARFPEMRGKSMDDMLKFMQTDPRGIRTRLGMTGVMDKDAAKYGVTRKGTLAMPSSAEINAISILQGSGEGWDQYQDARSKAVNPANAAAVVRAKEAEIASQDLQKIARADLEREYEVETKQLEAGRAAAGVSNLTFDQLLDENDNLGWMDRKIARAGYYMRRKVMGQSEGTAGAAELRGIGARNYKNRAEAGDAEAQKSLESLERSAQSLERIERRMDQPRQTVAPNGERPALPGRGSDPIWMRK